MKNFCVSVRVVHTVGLIILSLVDKQNITVNLGIAVIQIFI